MNGQAIKQDFLVLQSSVSGTIQIQAPLIECCYELPALAELTVTDPHFNDKHSGIWFFDPLCTAATIYLQKQIAGIWTNVKTITDNTYGTFYAFGFYTDKFKNKAAGFLIDWQLVLTDSTLGTGIYRLKCSASRSIGSMPDQFTFAFKLKVYSPANSDRTVRFEWNRNGVLGHDSIDTRIEDYGTLNWYCQIRLPDAYFGLDDSETERKYVTYPNGANQWLLDKQTETFTLNIYRLPAFIHPYMRVGMMMSGGPITITDYNKILPTKNIDRQCIPSSSWKPTWNLVTSNGDVSVTFGKYYDNLTHRFE